MVKYLVHFLNSSRDKGFKVYITAASKKDLYVKIKEWQDAFIEEFDKLNYIGEIERFNQ